MAPRGTTPPRRPTTLGWFEIPPVVSLVVVRSTPPLRIVPAARWSAGAVTAWLNWATAWRTRRCRCQGLPCRPCQRFARNCATHNLAPPHAPILGRAFHLGRCVVMGGSAWRCEPTAHRWHARGQGFKSPVSTSQRLWHSGLWAIRIVFTEQRTGSKLSCVGDPSLSAAVPRADAPDGLPADRPIVLPVEGGRAGSRCGPKALNHPRWDGGLLE